MRHIGLSVSDVSEGEFIQRFIEMFLQCQEIGEGLCRVVVVGEAVPDGNACLGCEFFDSGLLEASVFDSIEHGCEDAGGVGNGFFLADLAACRSEVCGECALVSGSDFECTAGSCGIFFEDEGKVLSLQCLDFLAFFLVFLKSGCEVQVVCEFFGCVVGHAQERFIE